MRAVLQQGWFRTFVPRPDAAVRLVCFPYAGGGATIFHGWSELLPESVELVAVQFPGRQDRHNEAAISDIPALADGIVGALGELLDRPVAFFGHSLGATVAFEVALRLRPRFPSPLGRLFVSARKAPADSRPIGLDFSTDDGMKSYLRRLGGNARLVLEDEDLWQLAMPALRSDLVMSEAYRYRPNTRITSPITAIAAELDHSCGIPEMERWADYTIGGCDTRALPGGHYYIDEDPSALLKLVAETIG